MPNPSRSTSAIAGRGSKVGCIEVRVLSSGTWDAPPMLLLTCERMDTYGYLINAGEGLQRFCVEHKMRLVNKLQRVLFTRMTWDATGGVPGLLLTMADGGHAGTVKLHGPARLPQLVSSFRRFVVQHAMPQLVSETPEDWPDAIGQTFGESGIRATPVLLNPGAMGAEMGAFGESGIRATPVLLNPGAEAMGAEMGAGSPPRGKPAEDAEDATGVRADEPAAKRRRLEGDGCGSVVSAAASVVAAASPAAAASSAAAAGSPLGGGGDSSMFGNPGLSGSMPPGPAASAASMPSLCWVLEMPPVPPKFDAAAAEALGVPSGPLRARLCDGRPVTLPNGHVITPNMVLTGGSRGEIVLIVDCPSVAHVEPLARHPTVAQFYRTNGAAEAGDASTAAHRDTSMNEEDMAGAQDGAAEAGAQDGAAEAGAVAGAEAGAVPGAVPDPGTSIEADDGNGGGGGDDGGGGGDDGDAVFEAPACGEVNAAAAAAAVDDDGWAKALYHADGGPQLHLVLHLSPPHVCATELYADWCRQLPPTTRQVFVNLTPQPQRFAFVASARLQLKLHGIHADVFPRPLQMPSLWGGQPLPPSLGSLPLSDVADMLCRIVIRPIQRAGLNREDEETLLRWQDSQGTYNTLQVRRLSASERDGVRRLSAPAECAG
jgi:hypothetical protein